MKGDNSLVRRNCSWSGLLFWSNHVDIYIYNLSLSSSELLFFPSRQDECYRKKQKLETSKKKDSWLWKWSNWFINELVLISMAVLPLFIWKNTFYWSRWLAIDNNAF
jgi:hypothetical protein